MAAPPNSTTAMAPNTSLAPCQSQLTNLTIDPHPPTVTPQLPKHRHPTSPPKLKLTLSAYHRSDSAVRLTDAPPSKLIHTDYDLLDPTTCHTLGHGASSTVRLAHHRRSARAVAVKTIAKHDALGLFGRRRNGGVVRRRDESTDTPRLEEVDVLTILRGRCKDVVQLLDVYETNTEVQLVLEYCEGGDLFDCIKRRRQRRFANHAEFGAELGGDFLESEVAGVAKILLGVLETLHSKHIVHRDVKPENVLLVATDTMDGSPLIIKLTDFGLARILRDDDDEASSYRQSNELLEPHIGQTQNRRRAYSRVGSDYYTAPEVNVGLGYDTPVDIFSLGITLYVMLCGAPPLSSQFVHSLYKLEDDNVSPSGTSDGESSLSESEESAPCTPTAKEELFPPESIISESAQDFICKLIHPDPLLRITASDALSHRWITQYEVGLDDRVRTPEDASKLSSPNSTSNRSRSLSAEETEALLKIPIQGSLHEIAPLVVPPSNSPKSTAVPNPPPVSLTLASVCSKLAPLVDEKRLYRLRRHKPSPKKHPRHVHEKQAPIMASIASPVKKGRKEQPSSGDVHIPITLRLPLTME